MTVSRSSQWPAACALCAITLLAYANSFESGFVFDNHDLLLGDSRIRKATFENLALIVNHAYWWPLVAAGLYRPVTTLSYLFNYAILGNADHPAGYHWINLLLHAGNVLLVFALARRLFVATPLQSRFGTTKAIRNRDRQGAATNAERNEDFWPSFLIAALWAVHPVLTESVTNIVGRADLLAGMTTLGGLLIYLKSTETAGWRRLAWMAGLTVVTAVGVFSKESAVAVLGVIALYELTWWNLRRRNGLLLSCLAMAPAFLAMWWMRSRVLGAEGPAGFPFVDNPIGGADFWTGRLTAVKVMAKYLGLLVWPAHLSSDYSYAQIPLIDGRLTDWIAWIVMAGVAITAIFLYRRNKAAFFAAGFAFITLLPASNLVIPVGTIMAERFLYLPAIGFAVCLVLALDAVGQRLRVRALAPVLLCLAIAGFGARTWARNKDWRDDLTFWSAAVEAAPLSFKTHVAFGKQILSPEPAAVDRALGEEERGLAILDPLPDRLNDATPWYQIGGLYVGLGDSSPKDKNSKYERARTLLLRAVSIMQAHGKAEKTNEAAQVYTYLMLSEVDERLGNIDDSLHWAGEARLAGPMSSGVYLRIHDALIASGRRDQAMAALMEGWILTSSAGLQRKLVENYAASPEESRCAISYAQAAPQIDSSCGIVRRQACAVAGEVLGVALKAGGGDAAMRLKKELAAKYGCGE